MSISELDALKTAAIAALAAADYDLAITSAMSAQLWLSTHPNLSRNLAGGGSQSITWNSGQIDSFILHCRKLKAASLASAAATGPFQQTKVVYARPDLTG